MGGFTGPEGRTKVHGNEGEWIGAVEYLGWFNECGIGGGAHACLANGGGGA